MAKYFKWDNSWKKNRALLCNRFIANNIQIQLFTKNVPHYFILDIILWNLLNNKIIKRFKSDISLGWNSTESVVNKSKTKSRIENQTQELIYFQ